MSYVSKWRLCGIIYLEKFSFFYLAPTIEIWQEHKGKTVCVCFFFICIRNRNIWSTITSTCHVGRLQRPMNYEDIKAIFMANRKRVIESVCLCVSVLVETVRTLVHVLFLCYGFFSSFSLSQDKNSDHFFRLYFICFRFCSFARMFSCGNFG